MRVFGFICLAILASICTLVVEGQAKLFSLPGVVPPSGCRDGAVLGKSFFIGNSQVRTGYPNDDVVAGSWLIMNNFRPSFTSSGGDTSVVLPPNCEGGLAPGIDALGLNLMAVRIRPTTSSPEKADIRELKLVWDVNGNRQWEPLLDLVLQTKPGSELESPDGVVFWNGPQQPLAALSNTIGVPTDLAPVPVCDITALDAPPAFGLGPINGTNSRTDQGGCFILLMVIATLGESPTTGTQFGLELEAMAGDIPGTTGISSFTLSSGFSSARNPVGAAERVQVVGGLPGSHTPIANINNGNGNAESTVSTLHFTGGASGEGLLTRFRAKRISPGTREVIAIAVAICEGGMLANDTVAVLPPIAGAPPTLAGGVEAIPCIPSANTDTFATGINGATLVFRGPQARFMSTVRMYIDECSEAGEDIEACFPIPPPPTTLTEDGGGDGFLFQPGELAQQVVPKYNEQTGEAIAIFGGRHGQAFFTGNNSIVGIVDPFFGGFPLTYPMIIIFTVDIDENASGGPVDVLLGLETFDELLAGGQSIPCIQTLFSYCSSNFLTEGPEINSFTIEAPEHPSTPGTLSAFDSNQSCFLDDPEFFALIDAWSASSVGDTLFFSGVDAWVKQAGLCAATGSASVSGLLSDQNLSIQTSEFDQITFEVTSAGTSGIAVEIFDLRGRLVYAHEADGTHLAWSQTTSSGTRVANGVYLYRVKARDGFGNIISSAIKKVIVLR